MIWLILLIALTLRFISLNQSLWLDEAINILAAKNNFFWDMVTNYAKYDFHPPGYFVIIWLWTKLFGYSEIAVRLPSVIFGVLTVLIIYQIGKKLYSKFMGLLAALLLAINPLHIYYSQEARMYSFATFAVCLNMFFFLDFFKTKTSNLGFIISLILVLSSDYLAYLVILAQFIILIFLKSRILRKWFLLTLLSIFPWLLWLPIFTDQINIGINATSNIPEWKNVVGSSNLKEIPLTFVKFIIGRISHPDKLFYATLFLPIGLSFVFFILRAIRSQENKIKVILLNWLFIPIILSWMISFMISVYSYFRLLFVLPAFLILVSIGFLLKKNKLAKIVLIFIITIQIVCSLIYLSNPKFQREDWKGLTAYLKQIPKDSRILFESNGTFAPFEYYSKGQIKAQEALKNFPATNGGDLINLQTELADSSIVYLINYLVEISDPQKLVQKELKNLGYKETEVINFNGVGFVYKYIK